MTIPFDRVSPTQIQATQTFLPAFFADLSPSGAFPHAGPVYNASIGGIASASSYFNGTYPPSNAIDGLNQAYTQTWLTANGSTSGWLQIEPLPGGPIIGYTVFSSAYDYRTACPRDWTFEGSDDGYLWTILDFQNNQTAWGIAEARTFMLPATSRSYRFYRLNAVTNNGAAYLGFGELALWRKNEGATLMPLAPVRRNRIVGNRNNSVNQNTLRWITLRFPSEANVVAVRLCIQRMNAPISQNNVCVTEAELYRSGTKITGLTATATDSHPSYPPAAAVDGSVVLGNYNGWFTNGGTFNTNTGYATNARGFEALMLTLPTPGAVDALRWVATDGISGGRVPVDFEIQVTTDPTATASDPLNSSKWFGVDLSNGKGDMTEFAATTDGGSAPVVPSLSAVGATLFPQTVTLTANLIPTMTSNLSPAGTAEASAVWSAAYDAWKAFSHQTDTLSSRSLWAMPGTSGWLGFVFPTPQVVTAYRIRSVANASTYAVSPRDWTFEGYDGTAWQVLDSRSQETNWSDNESRLYAFANRTPYLKYRINISANSGSGTETDIDELEMYGPASVTAMPYVMSRVSDRMLMPDAFMGFLGTSLGAYLPSSAYLSLMVSMDQGATWKTYLNGAWTVAAGGLGDMSASGSNLLAGLDNLKKLGAAVGTTLDLAVGLGSTDGKHAPILRGISLKAQALTAFRQSPALDAVDLSFAIIPRYVDSIILDAVMLDYTASIDNGYQFTFDRFIGGVTPPARPVYRSQVFELEGYNPRIDQIQVSWFATSPQNQLNVNLYVASTPSELKALAAPSFATVLVPAASAFSASGMTATIPVGPARAGSVAQLEFVYDHTEGPGHLSHATMAVSDFSLRFVTDEYTETPMASGVSLEASTLVYRPSGSAVMTLDTQTDNTYFSRLWALLGRPNGTSVQLYARAYNQDEDQPWHPIETGSNLPDLGRYLQLRLDLATTDGSLTPLVPRLDLTYTPDPDRVDLPTLHKLKTDELRYVFDVKMLTQMNRSNLTAMYVDVFEDASGLQSLTDLMLVPMQDGKGLMVSGAASGIAMSAPATLPVAATRFVLAAYDRGTVAYDVSFDGGGHWLTDVPLDAQMNVPLEHAGNRLQLRARLLTPDSALQAWGVIL